MGAFDQDLYRIVGESLEALCGLTPAPRVSPSQATAPWVKSLRVEYTGDYAGALTLDFYGNTAKVLEEKLSAPGNSDDALGEVANIVCGNVLPCVYGPDIRCRLLAPRSVQAGTVLGAGRLAAAVIALGEGRIEAHVAGGSPK